MDEYLPPGQHESFLETPATGATQPLRPDYTIRETRTDLDPYFLDAFRIAINTVGGTVERWPSTVLRSAAFESLFDEVRRLGVDIDNPPTSALIYEALDVLQRALLRLGGECPEYAEFRRTVSNPDQAFNRVIVRY